MADSTYIGYIALVESQVNKKDNYVRLPYDAPVPFGVPPYNNNNLPMSLSRRNFYIMGIYEDDGELMQLKDTLSMRMTINLITGDKATSSQNEGDALECGTLIIEETRPVQETYWFKALVPHCAGEFTITFDVPTMLDIKPITFTARCLGQIDVKPIMKKLKIVKSGDGKNAGSEGILTGDEEYESKSKRKLLNSKSSSHKKIVKQEFEDLVVMYRPVEPISLAGRLFDLSFSPLLSGYIYDDFFSPVDPYAEKMPIINVLFDSLPTVSMFLSAIPCLPGMADDKFQIIIQQMLLLFDAIYESHLLRGDERKIKYLTSYFKSRKIKKSRAETLPIVFAIRFVIALSQIDDKAVVSIDGESTGVSVEEVAAYARAIVEAAEIHVRKAHNANTIA